MKTWKFQKVNTLHVKVGAVIVALFLGACTNKSSIEKVLKENPDIVFNLIRDNPKQFFDITNEALRKAQDGAREDQQKAEQEALEEEFKNPKTPEVDEKRVMFGNPKAPITIVEYSDFQCGYCARGYGTVKQVLKEYGDKVRVVYKHLPLSFHELAMPAAQYFEAIALQDHKKAEKFHDIIFENQGELNAKKEAFLESAAKRAGADMARLKKDLKSEAVQKRIQEDMAEAEKFQFSGTPGFLINGVSLRGAYPFPKFKEIIDRHLGNKEG